nr:NUDIX domain-containing protein [Spelaeicoccus albus]
MLSRHAARVIVLDDDYRTLLIKGHDTDDADHRWWFTVGGGLKDGEDSRTGAARELREETGIDLVPSDLVGPVARRSAEFEFATKTVRQHEEFYCARVPADVRLSNAGWTALEQQTLDDVRWWTVEEIRSSRETVYPLQLAEVVETAARGEWDGSCRRIS